MRALMRGYVVQICKMEALGYTEDVRMILKEPPPSELEVLGAYSFACLPGQVEDAMEFMELKGNTAWEFLYTKAKQAILHELEVRPHTIHGRTNAEISFTLALECMRL